MAARSSHQLPTPLHKWASLRTELLWVYAGVVAPDNRCVTTDHRYGYWVWLLREGEVTVKMEGQTWKARRGQWMISPHGLTVQQFSDDARILSVHFLCQWPTRENLFSGREAVIFDAAQYPFLERSGAALQRLAHRHFPRIRIDLTVQAIGLPVFFRFQQLFLKWLMDFQRVMVERGKFLSQEGGLRRAVAASLAMPAPSAARRAVSRADTSN